MTTKDTMFKECINEKYLKTLSTIDIQRAISKNRHLTDSLKVLLIESCENTDDQELQKFLANEPLTSLRVQKKLLSSGIEIRLLLARRENLKKTVATALAKDSEYIVRKEIATNTIYPDILATLSKDSDARVIIAVTSNPNTSETTLEELVVANIKTLQEQKVLEENSVDTTCQTNEKNWH